MEPQLTLDTFLLLPRWSPHSCGSKKQIAGPLRFAS